MRKYRTKPVVIDAVQFNYQRWVYQRKDAYPMVDGDWSEEGMAATNPVVKTLEGDMRVSDGDYIIRGLQGEFYPCKPHIFKMKYELLED